MCDGRVLDGVGCLGDDLLPLGRLPQVDRHPGRVYRQVGRVARLIRAGPPRVVQSKPRAVDEIGVVHVEPQVFDVLSHLVVNRARVVPNDEANMIRWLRKPQEVSPESAMPDLGVTGKRATPGGTTPMLPGEAP